MDEAIKNFGKQFDFVPAVANAEKLPGYKSAVVLGMGGSHLAAGIIKLLDSSLDIFIHRDYGLPGIPEERLRGSLIIASSYSGNTEEVIDGLHEALLKGLSVAVIAVGGELLQIAKDKGLPYIEMPDTGIQPRSALGFSLVSLAHLLGSDFVKGEIEKVRGKIRSSSFEAEGRALAERLAGKVPLIYASRKNLPMAYNWKIKFNETGKVPAFFNVFPELNHNEMTGFDSTEKSRPLSENFFVIFLNDQNDHPQVKKRMAVTKELYAKKGLGVEEIGLKGDSVLEKIFSSLILADWAAFHTAKANGAEPNKVPLVEEFKKLIKS